MKVNWKKSTGKKVCNSLDIIEKCRIDLCGDIYNEISTNIGPELPENLMIFKEYNAKSLCAICFAGNYL